MEHLIATFRLLLDHGAKVDQRDLAANLPPLHRAASSERSTPALVNLLLAEGADVIAEGGQPVDDFLGATQTPLQQNLPVAAFARADSRKLAMDLEHRHPPGRARFGRGIGSVAGSGRAIAPRGCVESGRELARESDALHA